MMKLYYSDILPARKACAAARYLNSPVEYRYLDLPKGEQQAPDYLALNPNGKVPTLVEDGRTTWEADAVICRLSLLAGAALWPQDPALQIDIIRWLGWNAQHFGRAGGALYFEHIVRARFGLGEPSLLSVNEALADFRRYAAVLDSHLEGRAWIVGTGLSVADFSLAVTLPYAVDARIPLDEFPRIKRWHDRLNQLDAWRAPFPTRSH